MKGPQAQFFEFLSQGRFMLQRIAASGEHVFYPRWLPEAEGGWDWVEADGAGVVYSRTVIRQKPERGGDYCIAIVQLAEGPRMMTRVVGVPPDAVEIGMAVHAALEEPSWEGADGPVVVFRPREGSGPGGA